MTDIVERLRGLIHDNHDIISHPTWFEEAADEIERQGSHISHLEAHRDTLMAEIEQLRYNWHYANGVADLAIRDRNVAEVEVERLRVLADDIDRRRAVGRIEAELRTEIERLCAINADMLAALKYIADHKITIGIKGVQMVARDAAARAESRDG